MIATSNKIQRTQDVDVEALLPWYAAGTLSARDAHCLIVALASDPGLAEQCAAVRAERAETIRLNESLGSPSPNVVHKLFAAIDAETDKSFKAAPSGSATLRNYLLSLSPRAVVWSTALAILVSLLVGGVIGALWMKYESAVFS